MSDDELVRIEHIVKSKIRGKYCSRRSPKYTDRAGQSRWCSDAICEKYGEQVRMITFDPTYSRELCGGCHVTSTGKISLLKISSEGAVAAGDA